MAGLIQKQKQEEQMTLLGQKLILEEINDMKKQYEVFKINLERFTLSNKKQINEDPVFRKQFYQM